MIPLHVTVVLLVLIVQWPSASAVAPTRVTWTVYVTTKTTVNRFNHRFINNELVSNRTSSWSTAHTYSDTTEGPLHRQHASTGYVSHRHYRTRRTTVSATGYRRQSTVDTAAASITSSTVYSQTRPPNTQIQISAAANTRPRYSTQQANAAASSNAKNTIYNPTPWNQQIQISTVNTGLRNHPQLIHTAPRHKPTMVNSAAANIRLRIRNQRTSNEPRKPQIIVRLLPNEQNPAAGPMKTASTRRVRTKPTGISSQQTHKDHMSDGGLTEADECGGPTADWSVLVTNGSGSSSCGAALISRKLVLTVTSCVESLVKPVVHVHGGRMPVLRRVSRHSVTDNGDLSLLVLTRPVPAAVRPVCLPRTSADQPDQQRRLYAAGWVGSPPVLTSSPAPMNQLSGSKCHKRLSMLGSYRRDYGRDGHVDVGHVCVTANSTSAACSQLRGTPLVTRHKDGWQLLGLLQQATFQCGAQLVPNVYQRVYPHVHWVQQTAEQLNTSII